MLYLILLLQIFEGSWDSNTPVTHYFYAAVVAQYVRIIPETYYGTIAIRFELLGCKSKYTYYHDNTFCAITHPRQNDFHGSKISVT